MADKLIKQAINESEQNRSGNKYTIEDYAISFISGMNKNQRDRFKKMLEQGIECGESVALNYGINYKQLITEVKRLLKVEVK